MRSSWIVWWGGACSSLLALSAFAVFPLWGPLWGLGVVVTATVIALLTRTAELLERLEASERRRLAAELERVE